jgi:two-component system, NarL family, sensor histidine kinase DesK
VGRAAVIGIVWLVDGTVMWGEAVTLLVFAIGVISVMLVVRTNAELREAKEEIRTLAVAQERARLARDLHDVLGHSLTTITVKNGLARRMVETGADPERVLTEIREAEELARQALADIRATVSNVRRTTLTSELVGAGEALRAAGITAVLPQAVDDVPSHLQAPFGYVVREGVTNVIRHSGATRCEVELGGTWLEIRDDGAARPEATRGNGLTGLAERIAAVGKTGAATRAEAVRIADDNGWL